MKLAPHEVAQPLWVKLKDHYEERLVRARKRLENNAADWAETNRLRERIKEIKAFLDLASPGRERETDADE
jgi:hypothetical protein